MASTAVTIRVPEQTNERLVKAIERAGCSKTEWILEAIEWALERDEVHHVPKAIMAAMPRRMGDRMSMPEGITYRNL